MTEPMHAFYRGMCRRMFWTGAAIGAFAGFLLAYFTFRALGAIA